MSDTEGISERQAACLEVLEEMEAHRAKAQPGSKQLTIGLFDADRVWALSSADVSASDGLVIRSLTVHPRELNDDSSTASLRLLHGLHVSARSNHSHACAARLPCSLPDIGRRSAQPRRARAGRCSRRRSSCRSPSSR